MRDLEWIEKGERFDQDPSRPARLALAHLSFRRGDPSRRFEAHFPGLGLLALAQDLRTRPLNSIPAVLVKYFDEEGYASIAGMVEDIRSWLQPAERPMLGVTTYTSIIEHIETFLSSFSRDNILIIAGGPHVTTSPMMKTAHIIVRGEGVEGLRHCISTVGTPEFGSRLVGLCYQRNGIVTRQPVRTQPILSKISSPCYAYDLIPAKMQGIYATNLTRVLGEHPQVYVCTQSCTARCTFCSTYLIHGKQSWRPADLVAADLRFLVKQMKCDAIEFHDDDLLQHPEFDRILRIMGELQVPWFCYARVDNIEEGTARELEEAGCKRVFLGVESMNQRKLDYFNKNTTVADNRRAIATLSHVGIGVVAGFIIGAPQDTTKDVLDDLDEFLGMPLFALSSSILSPDPGTVEYHRASRRGVLSQETFPTPTVCDHISSSDLAALEAVIDAEFFYREVVWSKLIEGRNPNQIALIQNYYSEVAKDLRDAATDSADSMIRARAKQKIAQIELGLGLVMSIRPDPNTSG